MANYRPPCNLPQYRLEEPSQGNLIQLGDYTEQVDTVWQVIAPGPPL